MRRTLPFVLLGLLAVCALGAGASYNGLVNADQEVKAQWAQVENAYQRRADLVPNLVATVKGAAAFEQQTFAQVAEARASVGRLSAGAAEALLRDPAAFARFQQAQDNLGGALNRLLVVSERYPELKATENFRDLQAQLEGTENRITVERMRFNQAAQAYNSRRARFPTVLLVQALGSRFPERPYFQAQPKAEQAPEVRF